MSLNFEAPTLHESFDDVEGLSEEEFDNYDFLDTYTINDFGAMLLVGAINSYDGDGYFVYDGVEDSSLSVWDATKIPEGATHINWYGR